MIDVAAIRTHLETDLSDSALERVRAAAIADIDWYGGPLVAGPTYSRDLARRNALLVDMVKLGVSYNAVHVQALGQAGGDANAYTKQWAHLLRRLRSAVVS